MKILCVADHKDPLIYSPNLKERYKDVDLILGAGDLDLDFYGYIVSVLNKPLLFIFGNHNLKYFGQYSAAKREMLYNKKFPFIFPPSFGSEYIDGKVVKRKNLIIAGLGGVRRYNNGNNQFSEKQMWLRIFKLIPKLIINKIFRGRYLDILLTHAAPLGIHDQEDACHKGFKSFLWFLRKFSPKYLVHGHIHIYDNNQKRKTKYFNTIIINAYNHIILDTEKIDG